MFWAEIWKISDFFIWKFSVFGGKVSVYLNRCVFVMNCLLDDSHAISNLIFYEKKKKNSIGGCVICNNFEWPFKVTCFMEKNIHLYTCFSEVHIQLFNAWDLWVKFSAENISKKFLIFCQKTGSDISGKLWRQFALYQVQFSGKNKNKNINLLSAELTQRMVKVHQIQLTLVISTPLISILSLMSNWFLRPDYFPYVFIVFQLRVCRTTFMSTLQLSRPSFSVPEYIFHSFYYRVSWTLTMTKEKKK